MTNSNDQMFLEWSDVRKLACVATFTEADLLSWVVSGDEAAFQRLAKVSRAAFKDTPYLFEEIRLVETRYLEARFKHIQDEHYDRVFALAATAFPKQSALLKWVFSDYKETGRLASLRSLDRGAFWRAAHSLPFWEGQVEKIAGRKTCGHHHEPRGRRCVAKSRDGRASVPFSLDQEA